MSSGKWEKNCQGVRAPHSSPMNSIGVNGEQNSSAAPHATQPRRERRRVPVALRAVADLVVVLQVGDEPVAGDPAGVHRRPVVAAAEAAPGALVQERPGQTWASPVSPAVAKSA